MFPPDVGVVWPDAGGRTQSLPGSISQLPGPPLGGGSCLSASFRAANATPPAWPQIGSVGALGSSDITGRQRVRSMSPRGTSRRTQSPGWGAPRSLSPMARSAQANFSFTPRMGSFRNLASVAPATVRVPPSLSSSWSPHSSSKDLATVMRSASGTLAESFQAASPSGSQARVPSIASPQSSVRDLLVVSPPATSASLAPSPQLVTRQVGARVPPDVSMRHPISVRSAIPTPVATMAWHVPGFLPPAGSQSASPSGALPEDVVAVLRAPAGTTRQRVPPALRQSYSPQMRASRRVRWADNSRADSPNQLRRGVGDSSPGGFKEARIPVDVELLAGRPMLPSGTYSGEPNVEEGCLQDGDMEKSSPSKTFLDASLQRPSLKVENDAHVSSALGALSVVGAVGVAGGQRASSSSSHRPVKATQESSTIWRQRPADTPSRNERRRSPSSSPDQASKNEISLERARLEAERDELVRMRAQLDHERQLFETTKKTSLRRSTSNGSGPHCGKADEEDVDCVIHLNVGGEASLEVQRSTLRIFEGSYLADLFTGSWDTELPRDSEGRIFMDCRATTFLPLVEFLRQCRLERNLVAASNFVEDHADGRWKVALPKFDDPEEAEAFMRTLRFFGLERFVSGGFASGSVRAEKPAKQNGEAKRSKPAGATTGVKASTPAPKAARAERAALAKILEAKRPRNSNSPMGTRRPPVSDSKGRNRFTTPDQTPERRRTTPDRRVQKPARSDSTPLPRRGMTR